MRAILAQIEAEALKFLDRLGRALDEKRSGFSDYEAGDFLAAGGRMECDGPDAAACTCPAWGNPSWPHRYGCPADPFSAARDAAEPRSAPVEPAPRAPGADPRLTDPAVLLREAADYIEFVSQALRWRPRAARSLIAGLRDLAAQFDADEHSTT